MIIFILGPQGSGKDTQSELLSKKLGVPYFSTGELLRKRAKVDDELGNKINKILLAGELVPADIVVDILEERIKQDDCKNGFILNGYPRNMEQARMIEGRIEPDKVVFLEIPDDVALKRITSRMQCPKCGKVFIVKDYNPKNPPVCDVCNVPLMRRPDDELEIVKRRLKIYHERTEPLKDYYKKKGVLVIVDGTPSIEEVFESLVRALGVE